MEENLIGVDKEVKRAATLGMQLPMSVTLDKVSCFAFWRVRWHVYYTCKQEARNERG
jgi:hypothetical protein